MSAWESDGQSDEWYTPAYIFEALGCRFDLDVASPDGGPRHVPAAAWISRDSLQAEWRGFVWMNPPYGGRNALWPWLRKFVAHRNGVALVPDRTSAPWFQRFFQQADAVLFAERKIQFERPDGTIGKSPGTGSAFLAMGWQGTDALRRASHEHGLGLLMVPDNMRRVGT